MKKQEYKTAFGDNKTTTIDPLYFAPEQVNSKEDNALFAAYSLTNYLAQQQIGSLAELGLSQEIIINNELCDFAEDNDVSE